MLRTILAGSVVAAVAFAAAGPASAAWVCGPELCTWVNHPVTTVVTPPPPEAAAWPAPALPNCFWKKGFFGRWKYICPH